MLALRFSNISSEKGVALEMEQALLWIEADFVVVVPEGILLSEPYWCIVELATSLSAWLRDASENGPDFLYTSMEAEEEGLLRFRLQSNGGWLVDSAWQQIESATPIPFQDLRNAAKHYVELVLKETQPYLSVAITKELARVCA